MSSHWCHHMYTDVLVCVCVCACVCVSSRLFWAAVYNVRYGVGAPGGVTQWEVHRSLNKIKCVQQNNMLIFLFRLDYPSTHLLQCFSFANQLFIARSVQSVPLPSSTLRSNNHVFWWNRRYSEYIFPLFLGKKRENSPGWGINIFIGNRST
ncbi:unnamed protein product [Pylaiella littoralis]